MSADTIFTGKDEERTEKKEDNSATIFIVGKVVHAAGGVQLDDQTRLRCRRAVREYYQRTKIIRRRRNDTVTNTRITNKVFLVIASFDRRERERNEAIEQIKYCFTSCQHIPKEHIIEVREKKLILEDIATAIKDKKLPSNVIIIGEKPRFTWRNPLAAILKKGGIVPNYLNNVFAGYAS